MVSITYYIKILIHSYGIALVKIYVALLIYSISALFLLTHIIIILNNNYEHNDILCVYIILCIIILLAS